MEGHTGPRIMASDTPWPRPRSHQEAAARRGRKRTMFGRYAAECAVSHSAEFNHGIVSSALFARVPLAELGK